MTKKFYDEFKSEHLNFQKHIKGIRQKQEKAWYSSVVLNRLMFIWFLQKKGFLNDDRNYLQTKFKEYREKRYYSSFLKKLFFEGFAKKAAERSSKDKSILGDIKYLNGGLFVPHPIEEKYEEKINIDAKAFEGIFGMFSRYDWHNEHEGGDNEISPDVLGHIFEKYINDSQKKSLGAYYTPDEITGYLARKNIRKYVVEKVNAKGYAFESIDQCLHNLDAELCKILLTDEDSVLNRLSVLDPAVGSGAFLIAAMKELVNIYAPIFGKMETLDNWELRDWQKNFRKENKSIVYGIKKQIILKNLYGVDIMKEAVEVCKLRLFLSLASSALEKEELEPLPNIDFNIMTGNSLVGFLKEDHSGDQGFLPGSGTGRSYTQLLEKYKESVKEYKGKNLSLGKLITSKRKIWGFLERSNQESNGAIAERCRKEKLKYEELNVSKQVEKRRDATKDDIKEMEPFNWDFAFNDIVESGGFDIILTNPPWEKIKLEDKEFIQQYDEGLRKNTIKDKEAKKQLKKLLQDGAKRKKYIEQNSSYRFRSGYFQEFYNHQSGEITNPDGTTKKASSDMDMYRVFLERCLRLLKKTGRLGIVIPSGFGKDDGATGLRRFIFDRIKIEGLIDFQNQGTKGKIFDGVDSRFNFGLLNLKNDDPEDRFLCKFGERDLKSLETFPIGALTRSVKKIKEMSPRDVALIEFKDPLDEGIFLKAMKFPTLGEKLEDTWNIHIYREFDETNDNQLFKPNKSNENYLPLYKGGAIHQYEYNFCPEKSSRYVNKNSPKVKNGQGLAFKNKCYQNYRLVLRTIASSTNERTLVACFIPRNCFFSNSLHGVYIKNDKAPEKNALLLQCFFNSFILDYWIRQRVSSNINKRFLIGLRVPRLTEKDDSFNALVERSATLTCVGKDFGELAKEAGISKRGINKEERWKIQAEIDAIVAHIYGLTEKEYEYILGTFTKGNNQKRLSTLKSLSMKAFLNYGHQLAAIA